MTKNKKLMLEMHSCKNCIHFFQTGMSKSMSDGEAGYCLIIQNDESTETKNILGITEAKISAIKKRTDTCSKFMNYKHRYP